jgi:putative SOS response-associated peptidase YedK
MKDAELFAFAGLWDSWKDKETGKALETYTVITTDPNELMEPIHNRMPVILHRQDYDRWLEPGEPSHPPVDLLRSFPAEEMKVRIPVKWAPDSGDAGRRRSEATLVESYSIQVAHMSQEKGK